MSELDEVFNDETEVTEEVETLPEAEETTEEVETEEAEETTEESEETEESETKSEKGLIAALQKVRQEKRELANKLKEFESKNPSDQEPDMYEDPEGWKAWNRKQVQLEVIKKDQEVFAERLEISRDNMIDKYDNYEQVETIFSAFASQDKSLAKELLESKDPAKFAYEKGLEFIKELTGVSTKTEVTDAQVEKVTSKMPNLAKATAKGSNHTEIEKPLELNDMFGDLKY